MSWQLIKGDMRLSYLTLLWGFHTVTHATVEGSTTVSDHPAARADNYKYINDSTGSSGNYNYSSNINLRHTRYSSL